jgi:hypothetical protein
MLKAAQHSNQQRLELCIDQWSFSIVLSIPNNRWLKRCLFSWLKANFINKLTLPGMDRNDTPTEKPKARIPSAVSVKLRRLPPLQCALLWTEEETGFEEKVEVVEVDVPPHKFETGTKNHEGLAGTTAAINYLADLGAEFGAPFTGDFPGFTGRRLYLNSAMAAIRVYQRPLAAQLIAGLREILGVTVYGITDRARFDRRLHAVGIRTAPGGRMAGAGGHLCVGLKLYTLAVTERLTTSRQGLGAVLVIAAITLYVRHPTRPATLSEPRQSRWPRDGAHHKKAHPTHTGAGWA